MIRSFDTFTTNIKGLPEGEYLTETLYSDNTPWKVVGRTAATLKLQEVEVDRDPEWTPNIIPGGFAGHCTNQDQQTWVYAGLSDHTITVRLVKSRYNRSEKMWGSNGRRSLSAVVSANARSAPRQKRRRLGLEFGHCHQNS